MDYSNHSVVNDNIYANTHHCLGMLTVVCSITDTFKLDPLPAGLYNFNLILNSGFGGPPCTPGIVADDQDYLLFEVFDPSLVTNVLSNNDFSLYPNPSNGFFHYEIMTDYNEIIVYSINGSELLRQAISGDQGKVELSA